MKLSQLAKIAPVLAFLVGFHLAAARPASASDESEGDQNAVASLVGTPLLDLEIRTTASTDLEIPFCDVTCRDRDPTTVWFRITLLTNGAYSGSLTTRLLTAPAGTGIRSDLFSGLLGPERLGNLRQRLAEAHVGEQRDPCFVYLSWNLREPEDAYDAIRSFALLGEASWFGPRRAVVIDLHGGVGIHSCPSSLARVFRDLIVLAGRTP